MSYMRSYREVVNRVVSQASFLLAMKARATYVLSIIISIAISVGIVYRLQELVFMLLFISIVFIEFALLVIANSMIDELSSGEAQVYLATGLSRLEYVMAWITTSLLYPVLAIFLAFTTPILLLDPTLLFKPIIPTTYSLGAYVPTAFSFALAVVIQILNNILVSLAVGLATRKKYASILVLAVITILVPIFLSILVALFGFYLDYRTATRIYYVLIPLTPVFTRMIFSNPSNYVPEHLILSIPFAVAMLSLILILYYAYEHMEV